jgi:hypothetical protein
MNNGYAFDLLGALATQREDYRDQGAQRYRDQTAAQRAAVLHEIVRNANTGIEADRQFARGWLDEQRRDQARQL